MGKQKFNNRHQNTLPVHLEISTSGIRVLDLSKGVVNEAKVYGDFVFDETKVILEIAKWDSEIIRNRVEIYARRKGYTKITMTHATIYQGRNLGPVVNL